VKCPAPHCGAENAETAKFCRSCGGPLATAEEPPAATGEMADRQCPACGRMVPGAARFCAKCGCPIAAGPAENVEAFIEPRRAVAAEPVPEPEESVAHDPPLPPPKPADVGSATAARRETVAPGPTGGHAGRQALIVSAIAVALVVGSLGGWLYLGRSATPSPTSAVPAAAAVPAPPAPDPAPVIPATAPPAAAPAAVVDVPATAAVPASEPFRTLLAPEDASPANAAPANDEEARVRAEKARKRRDARLAREATERLAREAAMAPPPAPPPSSPKELCAGESPFSRNACEARACQSKEWMFNPFCVQRRRLEEQKRQGTFGTGD
jgi:hypothetical protein